MDAELAFCYRHCRTCIWQSDGPFCSIQQVPSSQKEYHDVQRLRYAVRGGAACDIHSECFARPSHQTRYAEVVLNRVSCHTCCREPTIIPSLVLIARAWCSIQLVFSSRSSGIPADNSLAFEHDWQQAQLHKAKAWGGSNQSMSVTRDTFQVSPIPMPRVVPYNISAFRLKVFEAPAPCLTNICAALMTCPLADILP